MALFSRKKKETEEKVVTPANVSMQNDLSHILMQPRITEKASVTTTQGAYVFNVSSTATKQQIKEAVSRYYKVTPRKVRIVTIPRKQVRNMRTGQRGMSEGGKKAYVHLKKGETITIS